jgi:hypothetical protein
MTYAEYGKKTVKCTHCGSDKVKRHITRVRIAKSEDSRFEGLAGDLSGMDGLEDDPRALAGMMRKMGKEAGEDLPPEFNEVVDRLEAGQSPDQIESAMPDLGASLGADDASMSSDD